MEAVLHTDGSSLPARAYIIYTFAARPVLIIAVVIFLIRTSVIS